MIKIFRSHVYLCTFTTAIFSLLQNGIEVYAATEEVGQPYVITVTPINGIRVISGSHLGGSNVHKPPLSGESGQNNYPSNLIRVGNNDEGIRGGSDYHKLSGEIGQSGHKKNVDNSVRDADSDGRGLKPAFYYYSGLYYVCDNCGEPKIDNKSYKITNENVSKYPSDPTAITVKGIGTKVSGKNVTVSSQVADKTFLVGVHVLENGKIVLEDPILKGSVMALRASGGVIEVKNGKIEESHEGVDAADNSFVLLEDTEIKTANGIASLLSYEHSEVWMSGGSVDFMNSHGISSMLGGKVNLENVKITGKGSKGEDHAVFLVDLGGAIDFSGSVNVTDAHGILLEDSVNTLNFVPLRSESKVGNLSNTIKEININSSSITLEGDESYGIYFKGAKQREEGDLNKKDSSEEERTPPIMRVTNLSEPALETELLVEDSEIIEEVVGLNEAELSDEATSSVGEIVNLNETVFSVKDDAAIYATNLAKGVVSVVNSTLSGGPLLKADKGASVTVLAVSSVLDGRAYVDADSTAELYLGDNSKWILQQRELHEPSSMGVSSVSLVSLMNDSSIMFEKLKASQDYTYQTLRIGKGEGAVYRTQDGAHIYLNTYLNEGGALANQKTDRLLIHGDVSGRTTVHVRSVSGSPGGSTGSGGNSEGISIIQVSGKAKEDSFQLKGKYVALHGLPYQYKLYAYGPESDLGKANSDQRLVAGDGDFWDFRLENRYIDSDKPEPAPGPKPEPSPELPSPVPSPEPSPGPAPRPYPEPGVKAVVPQVPTYLLLPNALFHAGLMNISNQNNRLEALRTASNGMLEIRENPAFFVRGYGGNHRYVSNLSALEYGYGGELNSNAIEAGILLQTIENAYGATSFGLIGSYERFTLQPLNVEQSQKSAFDKWTATIYGSMQHSAGFYVDGLLSYGLFKGDVLTSARGKTAGLKGNPLSASLTSGKAFMIGDKGLIFDPQVQVVYQRLQFNKTRDIDNFDIDMGKLDQWVARVGGRLTKTLAATDEVRAVSFYGKLHLAHGFEGKQSVHFKDAFQLGAFGSSLETGLGFNAQLSQKFALHGDLIYQHKLTKAGFSGTNFSGGLRYQF
ncbi:autotransporter outer membrane beta-barrel domain-containing protein [Bartonella taylorii]|uniref:autotransporter outer membrane beta-barrel domain-containing protein n=1 Tax=Bartonella taylorii TaxID=33046 RepID=UPI001ABB225D|nr:autotransporter outer membrane beta-barrel domain-containing protein [Bartonella taylorii]